MSHNKIQQKVLAAEEEKNPSREEDRDTGGWDRRHTERKELLSPKLKRRPLLLRIYPHLALVSVTYDVTYVRCERPVVLYYTHTKKRNMQTCEDT